MIICVCKAVNEKRIRDAVNEGSCCLKDIQRNTTACTQCKKCKDAIEEIIKETKDA